MCIKIGLNSLFFEMTSLNAFFLHSFTCFFSSRTRNEIKMDDENTDDIISAYQAELKKFKSIWCWHLGTAKLNLQSLRFSGWGVKLWKLHEELASHILSWREKIREKNSINEKLIPGSEQRNWLCGKMETLKVIMFVLPRRIMTSLCPEKVMLESFCSKQNHVAWLQRDFALNVKSADRTRIRTHVPKIKQIFKKVVVIRFVLWTQFVIPKHLDG